MATRVREKARLRKENRDRRPRAHARYIRIATRKCGIVVDLIRGKKAEDALAILMSTPKAASSVVEKLLLSAIANAENNLGLNRRDLYVAEIYANQGPTLKRMKMGSRGMGKPILKRTSHISIVLDEKE